MSEFNINEQDAQAIETAHKSSEEQASYNQSAENQVEDNSAPASLGQKDADSPQAEMLISAYKNAVLEARRAGEELERIKKENHPDKIYSGSEFIDRAVKNSAVREKVIESYLKGISSGESVTLLGGSGVTVSAPAPKANTLKEAKRLADLLMNQNNYN